MDYNLDNLEKANSNKDFEFLNVFADEEFPEQEEEIDKSIKTMDYEEEITYEDLGIIEVDDDADDLSPRNLTEGKDEDSNEEEKVKEDLEPNKEGDKNGKNKKNKVNKEFLNDLLDIPEIPAFNPNKKKSQKSLQT